VLAEIGFGDALIAEVEAPESLVGRSLEELDLRGSHGVIVLAIRRGGESRVAPEPGDVPASGDILVLMGPPEAVRRVANLQ
jgi:trk system potassium uptake protein TrkA